MKPDAPLSFSILLASTVHDMKNSIGLLMHQINQLPSQPDATAGPDQLKFEAARLNNYLIQLLTLYKFEQDQYPIQLDEYFLDEFVEDLLLMNQPILQPWGIHIEHQVPADLCWTFDRQLLVGVLSSIFTNVVRYARSRVLIELILDEGRLRIRIEDDGAGYPDNLLGELSARPMAVDFVSGSTGLGLYFAVQVAALHQRDGQCGRVLLSNGGRLGGGCFELTLP
ncbi:MAG: signal transduction histidine kinase [Motiliproteus sp.]|jgi:signal transduction histidine kinase